MKHLISKVKSLFKPKEKQVFIWLLDKDFFKNANIQFKEIDYSHIHITWLMETQKSLAFGRN